MANNRIYFWCKTTGKFIYLSKHYADDKFELTDEHLKFIKEIVNETPLWWDIEWDWSGWNGKCPFVFFSESIEDREDYESFLKTKNG